MQAVTQAIEAVEAMVAVGAYPGAAERVRALEATLKGTFDAGADPAATDVLWRELDVLRDAIGARDPNAAFAAASDLKRELANLPRAG
jgi:hypothetical protein